MKQHSLKKLGVVLLGLVTVAILKPTTASAQTISLSDYTASPPFITTAAPPLTMFVMSKNHKLFYKAYNDIIDLDNDGVIDSTYKDTIEYYGYFDPLKCYNYVGGGSKRFEPQNLATGTNNHYCSGKWSGNFLNWATMSRIDILRRVLYGGTRKTDTSTTTVLGRNLLPRDAHSWVKAYTGGDISSLTPYLWSEISLCNTNTSKTETSSLLLVINGNFPFAAGGEGRQCVKEEPGGSNLSITATLNVNVQVCVTGMLETNCLEYAASRYKPSGLMQKMGINRNGTVSPSDDTIAMKFGLITGSFGANVSGGVVRSNITDANNEVDNGNGQIKGSARIIKTLDQLKITQYNYTSGWYDLGGSEGTCVPSEPAVLSNGVCTSWGNPVGEMLYETIRYFKNMGGPSPGYQASPNSDPGFSSLDTESSWSDPYASCPACSKPFALILSDEFPSYDSDDLPGAYWGSFSSTDSPSWANVQTMMDNTNIDALEGIGSAFVGESAGTFDRACSSKTASFKSIRGLCIEEPTKQGSYYIAGLANYAKTTDLRSDVAGNQFMTTFAISTGSAAPNLEYTVSGSKAVIVPIFHDGCPNTSFSGCASQGFGGDNSKGAIVDFQLCQNDSDWTTEQGNGYTACYDVMWDDAEYGWDYDLDIRNRLYVKTGATTITVKTKGVYAAAGHLGFAGYSISGVTGGGEYYEVRCGGSAGSNDCDRYDGNETAVVERTFAVTGTTAGFLKSPLWYAAKYGGFDDADSTKTPNLVGEWDEDSDGEPDTFFDAANPLNLESQLTAALTDILNRSSSGTSVSVLATSGEGEGALYQAYFYPSKIEAGLEKKWIGFLHGLFLDTFGNLREDTDLSGTLVYSDDKIVRSRFDSSTGQTVVDRYLDADGDGKADLNTDTDADGINDFATPNDTVDIDQIRPIWEAGKQLALKTSSSRKVWTWINADHDGVVDSGEFVSFDDTRKTTLKPYLRASDDTESGNIINFIRGDQITGMRDRELTVSGATKVWKLGDIIYSTPVTVSAPRERYDLLYGNKAPGYIDYYKKYKDRRNVVYVGGNDGMLHAFNAGFYTSGDDATTTTKVEHGRFDPGSGKVLGEELWSYVPYELLPHLKWSTMPSYTHVYYVDLKPKVTDAKIFTAGVDPTTGIDHPNGWGTILIGGMRMGGKDMTVSDSNFPTPTTRTFTSAYFVLDITDPEKDPVLLASFTDTDLGLTTSSPTVLRVSDGTTTKWLFMVGSGPTTYDGTSTNTATIKIVNLATGALEKNIATTLSNAFMGDAINVDADLDFTSNVAYIGSSYQTGVGAWRGDMFRLNIQNKLDPNDWVLSSLYQANPGPIVAAPTASFGLNNKLWVYFGTGRYFNTVDQSDTTQQRFYGIKDPCWNDSSATLTCTTTRITSELRNTTLIDVKTDATVTGAGIGTDSTFADVLNTSLTKEGWYIDLDSKERVLAKASVLGGTVFFTTFIPNGDACTAGGDSYIHALFYETGTSYTKSAFGDDPPASGSPAVVIDDEKSLGQGMPSGIGIHIGSSSGGGGSGTCQGGVKGFVQQSTGTITEVCGDPALSIRSGVKGWRDF